MPLSARSAALLVRQMRPSSRKAEKVVEVFQINERNVMGFLEQDGQIWKAVVKRTGDGAETYLTTLHRAQPRNLVLARHRHKRIK